MRDEYVTRIRIRPIKPVILAVNKVITQMRNMSMTLCLRTASHYRYPLSTDRTGDVLDAIIENLPNDTEEEIQISSNFSLIGRPNVGKSSLINAILGEDRVIASPVAGTTRDAIDTHFYRCRWATLTMIDTAGMRKSGKIYENTEKYSVMRAMRHRPFRWF